MNYSLKTPYVRVPKTPAIPATTNVTGVLPDGPTMQLGPHAPKDAFPVLYPQHVQDAAQLTQVVNSAMTGKINCVNEMYQPIADVPQTGLGYYTIFDIRVSPFSMVIIQPESISARFLVTTAVGKGYFNVGADSFLVGQVQARGSMRYTGNLTVTTTWTGIPFDSPGPLSAKLMTITYPTLTTQMAGLYEMSLRISGVFNKNTTLEFRVMVDDAQYGEIVTYALPAQVDEIHDTLFGYVDVDRAQTVGVEVRQTSGSTSATGTELALTMFRLGNSETYEDRVPRDALDDILFKYAVIG